MRFVFDILFQDSEAVDLRGEPRCDRRPRWILGFRDLACRARRIRSDHRLELQFADDVAALAEGHHMALDRSDCFERSALWGHQLVAYRQKPFRNNVQTRGRHEMMNIGNTPGYR